MYDPYWILSAMVQAGAALIAIIGGMVGARYVSLQGDAVVIESAVSDLEVLASRTERELQDARDEAVRWDVRYSVVSDAYLPHLASQDAGLESRFLAAHWVRGFESDDNPSKSKTSDSELRDILDRVGRANEVALARFFFLENEAAEQRVTFPDAPTWSATRHRFAVRDAFDELVCAYSYVHQARTYWHKGEPDHPALATLDAELEDLRNRATDYALGRRRQAQDIVVAAQERASVHADRISSSRARLDRLPTTRDLSRAVWALVSSSLLMIVPSLTVMTVGPASVPLVWRVVLAGGFLVGMAVVLAFLGTLRPSVVNRVAARGSGALGADQG